MIKYDKEHVVRQICSRCIYDNNIPSINFDVDGVCNYCHQHDEMASLYGTGQKKGEQDFEKILDDIRAAGQGRKYDCVIGLSGGTDSSYLIMKAVDWGLRPLAVHYDNTWNSAIATMNIANVTKQFGVDLWTYVVDNKEVDDVKLAFMRAGVREFDADTDIALAQVMRSAAAKFGIKFILEGHSFMTEGISPVGGNYLDGAYVADIHKKFGQMKENTFPNMKFWTFMKWLVIYRQKFIRPFWYIEYDKESARKELMERADWQYYGGHHLENRASSFGHTVWLPQRFNVDFRNLTLAALVRTNKLDRQAAILEYQKPVSRDPLLIEFIKKRLELTDDEYSSLMEGRERTWHDFYTYKKRFEFLRPAFKLMADANLVPRSFYMKYCFPIKPNR
jgi:hypothetical protein